MPNKTISLTNEAFNYLMDYEGNKSEFVSKLIEEYVEEAETIDLDKLQKRKKELFNEKQVTELKIRQLDETINAILEKERIEEEKRRIKKVLEEFNKRGEELNQKWEEGEISENDYWEEIDRRKKEKEDILNNRNI